MKYAFLITHFGSGGTLLCRLINNSPSVCTLGASGLTYNHPTVLIELKKRICNYYPLTNNCIYLDKIVMNHHFCCKNLYSCKFIYLIRSPEISFLNIMKKGYDESHALDYYAFRLRRMCEMARRTLGILLTYEDITNGNLGILENYLEIKKPLGRSFTPMHWDDKNLKTGEILSNPEEPDFFISKKTLDRARMIYEKYFNFLVRNSGLLFSSLTLSSNNPPTFSSVSLS